MTTNSGSPIPTNAEAPASDNAERLLQDVGEDVGASENKQDNPDSLKVNNTSAEQTPENTTTGLIDDLDHMESIAELIHSLTDYEKQRYEPKTGQAITVETIKLEIPIELRISEDQVGQVVAEASAPSQRTITTVLPVFQRMQLTIVKDRDGS